RSSDRVRVPGRLDPQPHRAEAREVMARLSLLSVRSVVALMKITRVEPIHLRLPTVTERCDGSQETLVVKVHTDAGIAGLGEVDSSSLVAKAIIEAPLSHKISRGLAECVLGQDPFEIERLIHRMYEGSIFFGRQGSAIQAMRGVV